MKLNLLCPPYRQKRALAHLFIATALVTSAASCAEAEEVWLDADEEGELPADYTGESAEGDGHPEEATDVAVQEEGEGILGPYVRIVYPEEGAFAPNPVTFLFEAGGGVVAVWFECDGWPLQDAPIPAAQGSHTYDFIGVNRERRVILLGLDSGGRELARDEVQFTPTERLCTIPDQDGFNHYTVAVINDATRYPKDGTYPYCWEHEGEVCGENWGMIHDGFYIGQLLFPGGEDCFCSGHTLEIFLRAYRLWQQTNGVAVEVPYSVDGNVLTLEDVDIGDFYQHWQGFGVASVASSANAFESVGIGRNIYEEEWDLVLPGDYVNLSRSNRTGHAVIFVSWIEEAGEKVGLRYYGCNRSGDSCPDPEDPLNTSGNSGPSFKTEYFYGHGGTVLPQYLFIGRAFLPTGG